ncbi:MAG: P-loop NTPase [Pirellulaceae bacterium]|nr:P-loop NTPase [Pirellulaceae bacterium]
MALLPSEAGEHTNGELVGGVLGQSVQTRPDPMAFVHALRRRWLMIVGIGLLIAAPAGIAVWLLVGTQYTATAVLQISMMETPVAFQSEMSMNDPNRFEIFKNTQRQMIISRFVLSSALSKPEVARIPDIKRELREGDAVDWLTRELTVGFPGRAEVMTVSISLDNATDAHTLVKAVVDSYMTEYVNRENDRKRLRLSELEQICAAKEQDTRKKREQLKNLGQDSGSTDAVTLNTRQRIMLEELSLASRQMANAQFETKRFQGELAAQKAILANLDNVSVPEIDLDILIQRDPIARQLSMELGWKSLDAVYQEGRVLESAKGQYVTRLNKEVENLQQQYDARIAELAQKAREKQRSEIEEEILRLETLLATALEQQESYSKEIAAMRAEAEKFGIVSVEIQMLIADLKQQEMLASQLASERDKLRVELGAPQRITQIGTVEEPRIPSNTILRVFLTLCSVLAGFALPAVAIAFLDANAGRINNSEDVSKKLHVPVIGSMPRIPAHVIHRMSSPSKRHRTWHLRLTESVDGIAARLLRHADSQQNRVIMVSSATVGEGKTTLASQLALSLARTGRSTVLVDFDLRRPSFDEVFGVPLTPGVSELLRGEQTLDDLLHETNAENLSVISAGQWDRRALAALSNSTTSGFFNELRGKFHFVVADTSPILPVADARFVSQLVDAVILSVFRDISQASKIQAACEILTAFGVQSVEAVVTGLNEHSYGKHTGYESTVNA